jgi:hypothetical protein
MRTARAASNENRATRGSHCVKTSALPGNPYSETTGWIFCSSAVNASPVSPIDARFCSASMGLMPARVSRSSLGKSAAAAAGRLRGENRGASSRW